MLIDAASGHEGIILMDEANASVTCIAHHELGEKRPQIRSFVSNIRLPNHRL